MKLKEKWPNLGSLVPKYLNVFLVVCSSWGFESSDFGNYERCHLLSAIPWSAELRPPKASGELDPIPSTTLLHGGICTSDISRITAVLCSKRP